jgi:hypothetical protein
VARIRQLSAHEVGHTLGFSHNYYDSEAGRISVMDYPHPLVSLAADGTMDHSRVYAEGIGEWDKVGVAYGYQDFPDGTDERRALAAILDGAWGKDLRFMTNQDTAAHPRVDQWSNGTDPATELRRMMEVRQVALSRFGENAIRRGTPMALMEEALVPLFLHHRYQVEAAASALGGSHYVYALRGDGRQPTRRVPAAEQQAALDALLATLQPSALRVPDAVLKALPPRPQAWEPTRELFPRYTGPLFDAIMPAVVAAHHTTAQMLDPERAARLVEQRALDPALPGLQDVMQHLARAVFEGATSDAYEAEIKRAVERVLVERTMDLAARARMPQVRAVATQQLRRWRQTFATAPIDDAVAAHRELLADDIARFLDRPLAPVPPLPAPQIPPGAPIGDPGMDWLSLVAPACSLGVPSAQFRISGLEF